MTPPLQQRTSDELADAIRYLTKMLDMARHDPNTEQGALNAKVCEKGRAMLLWALGVNNEFGALVQDWLKGTPAALTDNTALNPKRPAHKKRN